MNKEQALDIVDIAVSAGQLTTLAAALDAADLIRTLKEEGPFTVFAAAGAAVEESPAGTFGMLRKPEIEDQLIAVPTYRVVPGSVMAADGTRLSGATTVNGADVAIAVVDGDVRSDIAAVVRADIGASNRVTHIIDRVILPH